MSRDSRELEKLVTKIQAQLAPKADVTHDVMLEGRHTGHQRQIDVLVREQIGQYDIKIIIDCKDYKTPVDVKGVEEFYGLLDDVGAQKGVLVCPRGFTATAKKRAEGLQIDLYSPVDTDTHKWRVKVTIPALCDFRNVMMSFGISFSGPVPLRLPPDFWSSCMIFDDESKQLGFTLAEAQKKWNNGIFPDAVGAHDNLSVFDTPKTFMDNGYGMKVPVSISVSTIVHRDLFFGQLPVPRISGFKDELSGLVISNAFTVGILSPEEVERDWQKIEREEDAPVRPVISLRGSVMWEQDGEAI
jgi:Restriction endonuclease